MLWLRCFPRRCKYWQIHWRTGGSPPSKEQRLRLTLTQARAREAVWERKTRNGNIPFDTYERVLMKTRYVWRRFKERRYQATDGKAKP